MKINTMTSIPYSLNEHITDQLTLQENEIHYRVGKWLLPIHCSSLHILYVPVPSRLYDSHKRTADKVPVRYFPYPRASSARRQ